MDSGCFIELSKSAIGPDLRVDPSPSVVPAHARAGPSQDAGVRGHHGRGAGPSKEATRAPLLRPAARASSRAAPAAIAGEARTRYGGKPADRHHIPKARLADPPPRPRFGPTPSER